ncbi:unnamed protein product [Amoebophrya sp. A25]|nr:unnamed protein product [Amoebophrya sp. A25]|eukprot:GSA25T00010638001.1
MSMSKLATATTPIGVETNVVASTNISREGDGFGDFTAMGPSSSSLPSVNATSAAQSRMFEDSKQPTSSSFHMNMMNSPTGGGLDQTSTAFQTASTGGGDVDLFGDMNTGPGAGVQTLATSKQPVQTTGVVVESAFTAEDDDGFGDFSGGGAATSAFSTSSGTVGFSSTAAAGLMNAGSSEAFPATLNDEDDGWGSFGATNGFAETSNDGLGTGVATSNFQTGASFPDQNVGKMIASAGFEHPNATPGPPATDFGTPAAPCGNKFSALDSLMDGLASSTLKSDAKKTSPSSSSPAPLGAVVVSPQKSSPQVDATTTFQPPQGGPSATGTIEEPALLMGEPAVPKVEKTSTLLGQMLNVKTHSSMEDRVADLLQDLAAAKKFEPNLRFAEELRAILAQHADKSSDLLSQNALLAVAPLCDRYEKVVEEGPSSMVDGEEEDCEAIRASLPKSYRAGFDVAFPKDETARSASSSLQRQLSDMISPESVLRKQLLAEGGKHIEELIETRLRPAMIRQRAALTWKRCAAVLPAGPPDRQRVEKALQSMATLLETRVLPSLENQEELRRVLHAMESRASGTSAGKNVDPTHRLQVARVASFLRGVLEFPRLVWRLQFFERVQKKRIRDSLARLAAFLAQEAETVDRFLDFAATQMICSGAGGLPAHSGHQGTRSHEALTILKEALMLGRENIDQHEPEDDLPWIRKMARASKELETCLFELTSGSAQVCHVSGLACEVGLFGETNPAKTAVVAESQLSYVQCLNACKMAEKGQDAIQVF